MIKIFHEIGHAAMCKRFGGEVNTIGVMFLLFMPLPYVDATSSWSLRNKWQRVLVSSGGMLIELFIGALACIVWASSPPGLVHGLAYNMMFTATVSTLLFNANPLLRFDGYYILVDLIEVPNLFQKSREQVYGLCKKYLFGIHSISPPARSLKEGVWLFLYGTGSMIYRIMLFTWIVLFIADRYFIIGIIIAIIMGSIWFLGPPLKLQKYLLHSPELSGFRSRAIVVSVVALSVPLLFVLLFPFPNGITVPGVVESEHFSDVITESSGIVSKIVTRPGSLVRTGQSLLILENPELDFELRQVLAKIEQITIVEQQTLRHGSVDRVPVRKHRSSLMQYLQTLEKQKKSLLIHARQDGIWSFPNVENLTLQWVSKGQNLGSIVNEKAFRFLAVIRQEDASDLFEMTFQKLIVRLKGQGWKNIYASGNDLLPHAQEILPSASLGWNGGGIVPIEPADTTGSKASEPFYLMHIYLIPSEDIVLKNGQTGRLRLEMPAQSLVLQFFRFLRQFLQKRYQL
jgi:putative peptide zinc metalloprotease protein